MNSENTPLAQLALVDLVSRIQSLKDTPGRARDAAARELISRYKRVSFSEARRKAGNDHARREDIMQEANFELVRQAERLPLDQISEAHLPGYLGKVVVRHAAKAHRPAFALSGLTYGEGDTSPIARAITYRKLQEGFGEDAIVATLGDRLGFSKDHAKAFIRAVMPGSSPSLDDEATDTPQEDSCSTEDAFYHSQLWSKVNSLIASLPEEQRIALRLTKGVLTTGESYELPVEEVAAMLNRLGLRTQRGKEFTPIRVYEMARHAMTVLLLKLKDLDPALARAA